MGLSAWQKIARIKDMIYVDHTSWLTDGKTACSSITLVYDVESDDQRIRSSYSTVHFQNLPYIFARIFLSRPEAHLLHMLPNSTANTSDMITRIRNNVRGIATTNGTICALIHRPMDGSVVFIVATMFVLIKVIGPIFKDMKKMKALIIANANRNIAPPAMITDVCRIIAPWTYMNSAALMNVNWSSQRARKDDRRCTLPAGQKYFMESRYSDSLLPQNCSNMDGSGGSHTGSGSFQYVHVSGWYDVQSRKQSEPIRCPQCVSRIACSFAYGSRQIMQTSSAGGVTMV
jgi:hypothetical protein